MKTGRAILGLLAIGIVGSAIFGDRSYAPRVANSSTLKATAAPQGEAESVASEAAFQGGPEIRAAAIPVIRTVRVQASSLRMRSEPSLTGAVVAAYPRGTEMVLEAEEGDWYRVTAPDGATGWMAAGYLVELPAEQMSSGDAPSPS